MLYYEIIAVCVVVVGVFYAFLRDLAPPDLIAMTGAAVLLIGGVVSPDDMFAVFSNPAPITIAAMFVLSAALDRTGVLEGVGDLFYKFSGGREFRTLAILMISVAIMSAFVNNTPVVVVFMPIIMSLSRKTGLKASRLLIPLSFASMLGGTCTLIGTSTNLLVDGVARSYGLEPFGLFEFSKLGIIYAVAGIAYLLTIGRMLLPKRETLAALIDPGEQREFLTQAVISDDSPLIGKTISDSALAKLPHLRIIEVSRMGQRVRTALNKLKFHAGDLILLKSGASGVKDIEATAGIDFPGRAELGLTGVGTESARLMEGIIGPQSNMVGKTLKELNFRQKYGALILAIHRQGQNIREQFENVRLAFGDTILVEGPATGINRLMGERDFLSLTESNPISYRRSKAPIALIVIAAVVGLATFKVLPVGILALLGVVVVVLTRCLDSKEAYDAIDWKTIVLIFGMLAIGVGVENSGTASLFATKVTAVLGDFGPVVMISAVYLLAVVITELISNNATAVLLAPVVITIANQMNVEPRPFIVALMFGCSACFATPIGYQTNTYVYGAGGYKFSDFPRVGILLNIILWIVASICIPLMWPLQKIGQ